MLYVCQYSNELHGSCLDAYLEEIRVQHCCAQADALHSMKSGQLAKSICLSACIAVPCIRLLLSAGLAPCLCLHEAWTAQQDPWPLAAAPKRLLAVSPFGCATRQSCRRMASEQSSCLYWGQGAVAESMHSAIAVP